MAERAPVATARPSWGMLVAVAWAVVPRPALWGAALVAIWRLAAPGWWRAWPPLPLPPARYWGFRMETAYGEQGEAGLRPSDVVSYLEWCKRVRSAKR